MTPALYIGLISGTSRDGLDAALVDLSQEHPRLLKAACTPYPESLRAELDHLLDLGRRPQTAECMGLDMALGGFFADACQGLLDDAGQSASAVMAIGSHGQTVWHEPNGPDPVSLQIGNAEVLSRQTGLTVVSDFRSADLALGGQGAPLAPLLHRGLFGRLAPCAVLNLGGIANLTLLEPDGAVSGFDTGPANCLLDSWCLSRRGEPFDDDGAWAASGQVLTELLEQWLEDPYFALPTPKSTGLEHFNRSWLAQRLQGDEAPEDVQRTLMALTVESVAQALERHATLAGPVLVCGGGVHNGFLMRELAARLPDRTVESTQAHGIDPDWVEAVLFAWLAQQRLADQLQDTAPITGARAPALLGRVTPAPETGAYA
ncbi:MAG: anhydro-N-acetylmuramic acid kinase [Pseudomonadota bacterium]